MREGGCPWTRDSLQVWKAPAPAPGLQDTKDTQCLAVTGPWEGPALGQCAGIASRAAARGCGVQPSCSVATSPDSPTRFPLSPGHCRCPPKWPGRRLGGACSLQSARLGAPRPFLPALPVPIERQPHQPETRTDVSIIPFP